MSLKNFFPLSLFSRFPPIVGLEIDSQCVRLACVRLKKGKIKVEFLREQPLTNAKKLLEGISNRFWFSLLLPQRKVMVRNVTLKSAKIKDALRALEFELEPKLPFSIQNAILQTKLEKKQKNELEVTAYICEKQSIKEFLSLLKSKSLFADSITCVADSLAHLFSYDPKQKDKENILLYFGMEECSVILAKNGRVLAQQSFLMDDKQLAFSIQRTTTNFFSRSQTVFSHIYLFGAKASQFSAMVHEVTKKNIHTLTLPIKDLSEQEWRTYAPAIGAALSQKKHPINFRQKEFASKFPYKRELFPAILTFALSILSAITLFFAGEMVDKKEREVHKTDLVAICDFINQNSSEISHVSTPFEFQNFSSRLSQQLREKNLDSLRPPFQISEILYDISQKITSANAPLQGAKILDFQWEIKKRATPSAPHIPYAIECKLILETLSDAGQSVQRLLEDAYFVDRNQEISITAQDKMIIAKFMLAQEDL